MIRDYNNSTEVRTYGIKIIALKFVHYCIVSLFVVYSIFEHSFMNVHFSLFTFCIRSYYYWFREFNSKIPKLYAIEKGAQNFSKLIRETKNRKINSYSFCSSLWSVRIIMIWNMGYSLSGSFGTQSTKIIIIIRSEKYLYLFKRILYLTMLFVCAMFNDKQI